MKSAICISAILSLLVVALSASLLRPLDRQTEFLDQRAALVIRKIGHEILLKAGDSSSRLLPVRRVNTHTFELTFQDRFSFVPDSLIALVGTNLQAYNLPSDYVVNVFEGKSPEAVYGFAISPEQSVLPCLGRAQPEACYRIQITFAEVHNTAAFSKPQLLYFIGLGSMLLFSMLGKVLITPAAEATKERELKSFLQIGAYRFDPQQRMLWKGKQSVPLSDKENKLLGIFAQHPNQLLSRDLLLQEVWENEGVFTARSLDVYVSRLRKKLSEDATLALTNVHGQGYKLEVKA